MASIQFAGGNPFSAIAASSNSPFDKLKASPVLDTGENGHLDYAMLANAALKVALGRMACEVFSKSGW